MGVAGQGAAMMTDYYDSIPTMRVIVSAVAEGAKIQSIKEIRSATGLPLKDAKAVADDVESGKPREVVVRPGSVWDYTTVVPVPNRFQMVDFVDALGRYPQDMTVGQLLAVLLPTRDLVEAQ
jgi:hypothetical protein